MVGEDVDVNIKKLDAHDVAKYVPIPPLLPSRPLLRLTLSSMRDRVDASDVNADSQPYITPRKLPNRIIQ